MKETCKNCKRLSEELAAQQGWQEAGKELANEHAREKRELLKTIEEQKKTIAWLNKQKRRSLSS